jgi:hypothetical protein
MTDADFSRINLQYLICARDLVRRTPQRAPLLLGVPGPLGELFGTLSPDTLAAVTGIRPPLLVPRQEPWWWERLLRALQSEHPEEIAVILEHAGLLMGRS